MHHSNTFNVASFLDDKAKTMPNKKAVIFPKKRFFDSEYTSTDLTFFKLNEKSNRYASGLDKLGVRKGKKILLMVRPGLEFVSLTFALFKIGAVPILIDPGMGVTNVLNCVQQVKPDVLIAIPIVHLVRTFKKACFSSIKIFITVSKKKFWGISNLNDIDDSAGSYFTTIQTKKDDPAAILFTTGSTGVPKGVLYQHGMFMAQVKNIKTHYKIQETDVDMPAFPLFALFSAALGMTCIIPDMNPTKPAKINPKKLTNLIKQYGVTNSFGSPAIWDQVGKYCVKNKIKLPTFKRILMAGAPVRGYVMNRFQTVLPMDAKIFTPYGATEALPVTSITASERRDLESKSLKGAGTCVGKPLPGMIVKIIKIIKGPILEWDKNLEVGKQEKGEIVVKGDVVTKEYYLMPEQTRLGKIKEGKKIWHRMGDIGYFDDSGRLWFCGRKTHSVQTKDELKFTIPCEAIFNQHPKVYRSALVGIGEKDQKRPVIIIEPMKGNMPKTKKSKEHFISELLELGKKHNVTNSIHDFLFHSSFPVDIRHNVKIFREKLAIWAEKRVV